MLIPDPDIEFLPNPDPGVKKAPNPRSGSATQLPILPGFFLNDKLDPDSFMPYPDATTGDPDSFIPNTDATFTNVFDPVGPCIPFWKKEASFAVPVLYLYGYLDNVTVQGAAAEFEPGLWIRIHFFRIRIQSLRLETNTDPDPDPGL
jgi:hypothetical protein